MLIVYWSIDSVSPRMRLWFYVFLAQPEKWSQLLHFKFALTSVWCPRPCILANPTSQLSVCLFFFLWDKSLCSPSWLWTTSHVHLLVLCEASTVTSALQQHLPLWFCDMHLSSTDFMLKNHKTRFKTRKSQNAHVLSKHNDFCVKLLHSCPRAWGRGGTGSTGLQTTSAHQWRWSWTPLSPASTSQMLRSQACAPKQAPSF